MRIAILTSGVLPVPAVQGGAVENLIDFCLEYNDRHHLHDITVYSVSHPAVRGHEALRSQANHYRFIDMETPLARLRRYVFRRSLPRDSYYSDRVEYYLHRALSDIRRRQYDVVIVENRPGYVLELMKQVKARIVIHQENDYLNSTSRSAREIYDATTLVINTSEYITRRVRTIEPNDTKCVTVLNGIDTRRFTTAQPMDRRAAGLTDDDFVIVYSGRLTKDKGILELLQAMRKVSDIPNIKLLIIGASAYGKDKEATPFIRQLQETAADISERVVFTGYISYEQVPAYLKMGDIAVVPSVWEEPFGLTVVEAMACGLPLITTRSGGIPEICEGLAAVVDRKDIVDNLAQAITDLYHHPEKRTQMAKALLERSALFDKDTYARNFFAAIK